MENRVLRQKQIYIYIGIIVWFIVKIQFYQYVGFPQAIKYASLASIFAGCMLFYCISDILDIERHKIMSLTIIGVFISYCISIVFWGASPYQAIKAHSSNIGLLYVAVFFALRKFAMEKKTAEYIMITLAVVYLLCWAYSLYMMPEMIFGIDRDGEYGEITKRGFYRVFIPGNVSAVLSFYFLNSYFNKKEFIYLVLTFLMFIVVVLHVGRQMILWTMIISALMLYKHYRKKTLYLLIAVVVVYIGFLYVAKEIPAISAMIEISEKQGENYEDDIRIESLNFFLFEYPRNFVTTIFGNGVPVDGTELYNIRMRGEAWGYHLTDVGFFAMFCNYGIWGVLSFFFLLLRVVKLKVEPEYEYFKYYIIYLFGVYLMSQSLTSHMFEAMIAYYVVEKSATDFHSYNNKIL